VLFAFYLRPVPVDLVETLPALRNWLQSDRCVSHCVSVTVSLSLPLTLSPTVSPTSLSLTVSPSPCLSHCVSHCVSVTVCLPLCLPLCASHCVSLTTSLTACHSLSLSLYLSHCVSLTVSLTVSLSTASRPSTASSRSSGWTGTAPPSTAWRGACWCRPSSRTSCSTAGPRRCSRGRTRCALVVLRERIRQAHLESRPKVRS
jgi:hypothetical protein